MFLSTENPPHDHPLPSSPSSLLHLTTSSSDELGQTHLQNFSIRDYAYSNRKNNIKNNWPFSPKSLQLCSTHGVTDPLPPFQKVSNASNKFETTVASSSSGKQIVSHVHRGNKLVLKGSWSQSRMIIKNGFGTSTSVSKSKVETTVVVAGTSNNNKNIKKCGRGGLMVKSKEDTCGGGGGLVMTTTTTCPICKTFSSASNTTLNAHIDQCLSADSELPPVSSTKPNKPRVDQCLSVDSVVPPVSTKPNKPRAKALMKVKTMVDIYASAKGCTLEDLDKRNGTKWASVLIRTNQVIADKTEVLSKKRKGSPVGVGPVYIDEKGQKLRILTEFSEKKTSSSTTPLREQYEDGSKESSRSSRKRRGGKKQYKYLKPTNLKANNTSEQIPECERVFSGEGSSTSHHRRIYNQRMLSKRGLISKKLNEKEQKLYAFRDQPSEEEDDDDDSWSGGERLVLRGTDSSPLNKQKLRREVSSGRNKTMFGSKGAQSRSSRVQVSEKVDEPLARAHLDTVMFKKKRLASIQEDKYPLGKNVRDLSPRATSMRKSSAPFVANGWRRLSLPMELKKARLDSSEEEEEESGKWESEMTQECELSSDDDYVSGDDDSPSFSRYDDDEEESSDEEEEDDDSNNNNNNKRANVLDTSNNDATTPSNETIPTSEREMYYYYSEQAEEMIYEEEDVRFDSEGKRGKGSLFVEVDTIPIPGPPGSFLPSPRDMCYDGNSSVITSQLQSFDRNSSESPVSNFAAGGRLSFCVPSHHETITVDKTTSPRFRNNDDHESCCCQRKERIVSEGNALNHHQASHLLQRRASAYSSTSMNLTKSPPTRLDPNHPFERSPPYMIKQDLDLESKFSNRAVLVPPSPNPVLRLMGKDLMVMNQVEADNNEEATRFLDPLPCAGTGLYLNTDLYLRKSLESTTYQPQTQASPFRNNCDHVR